MLVHSPIQDQKSVSLDHTCKLSVTPAYADASYIDINRNVTINNLRNLSGLNYCLVATTLNSTTQRK